MHRLVQPLVLLFVKRKILILIPRGRVGRDSLRVSVAICVKSMPWHLSVACTKLRVLWKQTDLSLNPDSALYNLCALEQVTEPLAGTPK